MTDLFSREAHATESYR